MSDEEDSINDNAGKHADDEHEARSPSSLLDDTKTKSTVEKKSK